MKYKPCLDLTWHVTFASEKAKIDEMGYVFLSKPSTSFAEQEQYTGNYDGNKIAWTWGPSPFSSLTKPRRKPSKFSTMGVSNPSTRSSARARVAWSCILLRASGFSRVRKWTQSFAPRIVRFHGGCETLHHNILIIVHTKNWIHGPPRVGHVSALELLEAGRVYRSNLVLFSSLTIASEAHAALSHYLLKASGK